MGLVRRSERSSAMQRTVCSTHASLPPNKVCQKPIQERTLCSEQLALERHPGTSQDLFLLIAQQGPQHLSISSSRNIGQPLRRPSSSSGPRCIPGKLFFSSTPLPCFPPLRGQHSRAIFRGQQWQRSSPSFAQRLWMHLSDPVKRLAARERSSVSTKRTSPNASATLPALAEDGHEVWACRRGTDLEEWQTERNRRPVDQKE